MPLCSLKVIVDEVSVEKLPEVLIKNVPEIIEKEVEVEPIVTIDAVEPIKNVETAQPSKLEQQKFESPQQLVDPNVAILQQQISALQTQLLNMASFAMNNQQHAPQNFFHPSMMYKYPVPVPTRDASTSPIPYPTSIYKHEGIQTDCLVHCNTTNEVSIQTDIEVEVPATPTETDQIAETEMEKENNLTQEEKDLGVSEDGKNIIMGLVENAEQSFIFTDKSEGESIFTSPATSIFNQPKPSIVKRIPFSRLRGNTTITEESFSRTEMLTFDDASLSFATTKYLEKYGLSP
jgi:hypothetical protein